MAFPDSSKKAPNVFVEVIDETGSPAVSSSSSSSTAIIVNPPPTPPVPTPTVDFSAVPLTGTVPLMVSFTDLSTGSPTSWAWDFTNDGTVDSTLQNPVYTYSTPGTYSVKLTATNSSGSGFLVKIAYIEVTTVPVTPLTVDITYFTVDNSTLTADMVSY